MNHRACRTCLLLILLATNTTSYALGGLTAAALSKGLLKSVATSTPQGLTSVALKRGTQQQLLEAFLQDPLLFKSDEAAIIKELKNWLQNGQRSRAVSAEKLPQAIESTLTDLLFKDMYLQAAPADVSLENFIFNAIRNDYNWSVLASKEVPTSHIKIQILTAQTPKEINEICAHLVNRKDIPPALLEEAHQFAQWALQAQKQASYEQTQQQLVEYRKKFKDILDELEETQHINVIQAIIRTTILNKACFVNQDFYIILNMAQRNLQRLILQNPKRFTASYYASLHINHAVKHADYRRKLMLRIPPEKRQPLFFVEPTTHQ